MRPRADAPFEGRVARYPLGPLTLYRLTADASRVTRTRAMIGASDPEWVQVSLLLGGPLRRRPGRAPLGCCARATSRAGRRRARTPSTRTRSTTCSSRTAPSRLLRAQPASRRSTATTIPGADGAGRSCAATCARCSPTCGPAAPAGSPGSPTGSSSSFGALYDGTAVVPRAPDALRTLVRGHIDEHLGDPALDPESIAAAHFISRRQLDRLFADGERTVAETIRDRRLERCRRDLRGPDAGGRLDPRHRDALGVREPGALQPRVPRGLRDVPERARQRRLGARLRRLIRPSTPPHRLAAVATPRRRCARRRRRSSDRSRSPRPRPRATARRRRRPRAAPGA